MAVGTWPPCPLLPDRSLLLKEMRREPWQRLLQPGAVSPGSPPPSTLQAAGLCGLGCCAWEEPLRLGAVRQSRKSAGNMGFPSAFSEQFNFLIPWPRLFQRPCEACVSDGDPLGDADGHCCPQGRCLPAGLACSGPLACGGVGGVRPGRVWQGLSPPSA